MTVWLTVEDVIAIHDKILTAPLRDYGSLAGAVNRPQTTYEGVLLYRSIYLQTSVLLHSVQRAQAFAEGNKRTAWASSVTFLELNGLRVPLFGQTKMADYMSEVAAGVHSELDTAQWLAAITT